MDPMGWGIDGLGFGINHPSPLLNFQILEPRLSKKTWHDWVDGERFAGWKGWWEGVFQKIQTLFLFSKTWSTWFWDTFSQPIRMWSIMSRRRSSPSQQWPRAVTNFCAKMVSLMLSLRVFWTVGSVGGGFKHVLFSPQKSRKWSILMSSCFFSGQLRTNFGHNTFQPSRWWMPAKIDQGMGIHRIHIEVTEVDWFLWMVQKSKPVSNQLRLVRFFSHYWWVYHARSLLSDFSSDMSDIERRPPFLLNTSLGSTLEPLSTNMEVNYALVGIHTKLGKHRTQLNPLLKARAFDASEWNECEIDLVKYLAVHSWSFRLRWLRCYLDFFWRILAISQISPLEIQKETPRTLRKMIRTNVHEQW